MGYDVLGK